MNCPNCGFENRDGSNFCMKCGTKLEQLSKPAEAMTEPTISESTKPSAEPIISESEKYEVEPIIDDKKAQNPIIDNRYDTTPIQPSNSKLPIVIGAVFLAVIITIGTSIAISNNRQKNQITVTGTTSKKSGSTETSSPASETTKAKTTKKAETTKKVETTKSTTTKKEQKAHVSIITPDESDSFYDGTPASYQKNGISISFDEHNEYYKSAEADYTAFISLCTYTPNVSIANNSAAADKIRSSLQKILELDPPKYANGYKKTSEKPSGSMYDMSETKRIKSIYNENDLLFITIVSISDNGGGMSLAVYSSEETHIFNVKTGDKLFLDDLVTDKQGFLKAIDNYISDVVYQETFMEPHSDINYGATNYVLCDNVDFDTFVQDMEQNTWYDQNWTYNGEYLSVEYHFLLGYYTYCKDTIFYIPKYIWKDYVDFGHASSSNNVSFRDSLGNKIMNGNTAANYANYSTYCFDDEYIYYAGGIDGYHWQLKKCPIGGNVSNGTLLTEDMTDTVMIDGDTVYYRNANDEYKLYSIGKNGENRKKITDHKVSAARIYDGSIYFSYDNKLYRMNKDGSGKTKILDRACYDLQIYNDRIYTTSDDNSCIMVYDMSGKYLDKIRSGYTTTIKWFFISSGYCVMSDDNSISFIDVQTGIGPSYIDLKILAISENKDNFLVVIEDEYGESVYKLPKNDIESYYFYGYSFGVNNRQILVVYDRYETYLYTFDKDGAVSYSLLGGY